MHDGGGTEEKWGLQIDYPGGDIVVEEVIQTSDSGYVVLGSNMWLGNNHQGVIVKINNSGSIDWERTYSTAYRNSFF